MTELQFCYITLQCKHHGWTGTTKFVCKTDYSTIIQLLRIVKMFSRRALKLKVLTQGIKKISRKQLPFA